MSLNLPQEFGEPSRLVALHDIEEIAKDPQLFPLRVPCALRIPESDSDTSSDLSVRGCIVLGIFHLKGKKTQTTLTEVN